MPDTFVFAPEPGLSKKRAYNARRRLLVRERLINGNWICTKCKDDKPIAAFSVRKGGKRIGQVNQPCRACAAQISAFDYAGNPEKYKEKGRRYRAENPGHYSEYYRQNRVRILQQSTAANRRRRYGIEPQEVTRLIELQGGKCAACKRKFGDSKMTSPSVDHCHYSGHVRGILCHRCNMAEGLLQTPAIAKALLEYMTQNELLSYGHK
jgi:hypothetical protein